MSSDIDIKYMEMALSQAVKGMGRTSPNPCVGAVIVKDGEVVGKGFHKKAGTPHAEIHALADAGTIAREATMYVTLEPCNHTGKTPPCSHAVANAGIKRVVVGMRDPNPLVDGSGIDYLRDRGIEVKAGVLEDKCVDINRPFLKHIATGKPFLIMKAGISLDGKVNYEEGKSGWITGAESGRYVHGLRDRYDAIMVGSNTVLIDNPSLTTRLPGGAGRDPVRIVIDSQLRIPVEAKVFSSSSGAYCWLFCGEDSDEGKMSALEQAGVRVSRVARQGVGLKLDAIFTEIGKAGLCSVLVEGGATLHGSLLRERMFDYAYLFKAPIFAGEGGISLVRGYSADNKNNSVHLANTRLQRLGEDFLIEGEFRFPQG